MKASKKVTPADEGQIKGLLNEHNIKALVAKHTPEGPAIDFDIDWLGENALAASFPRIKTAGPYFITLSPLLIEWKLTDRTAFSTIILHEVGHVIDRAQNWTKYSSSANLDHEALEYEADSFVVACGYKDSLIQTLRRSITAGSEHGVPEGISGKRLLHLVEIP